MVMGFASAEVDIPQKEFIQHICECLHGDSIHNFEVKEGIVKLTNCLKHDCNCTQYKEHLYSPAL